MGSANKKQDTNEKLVKVSTSELKNRLNRLYGARHGASHTAESGRFDYLWDLKELALMEGRQSIDVPESWLEEMEKSISESGLRQGH